MLAAIVALGLGLLVGPAVAQTETFPFSGAKVPWSPTVDGTYRVTAIGGQGGGNASLGSNGSHAAEISATFELEAGKSYSVAVGKAGDSDWFTGGGGGGTFFAETGSQDIPLLIAGGGGGGRDGSDAAASFVSGGPAPGGLSFDGYGNSASAGGGWLGDGADGEVADGGGHSWVNGLRGGDGGAGSNSVRGGYGGGGSGYGSAGGGGGGYSGGNGGFEWFDDNTLTVAAAGTSFSAGTGTTIVTTAGLGDGSLTIELIEIAPPDTSDDAEASIADYLATRNRLLLATAPDINRFIHRFYGGGAAPGTVSVLGYSATTDLPFALALGADAMNFSFSSVNSGVGSASDEGQLLGYAPTLGGVASVDASEPIEKLAFWAEGSFARASDDTLFGVVHVGGDYLFTDSVLVGISAEIDSMRQEGSTLLTGTGYSVGPYLTAKLSDALFLDARLAGGQSFNEITQDGAPADAFTGTRWLGSAALVGRFDVGIVRIAPEARIAAVSETSDAYTDHNGDDVSSVTATTATAELGPRLSLIPEADGGLAPYLGLSGNWTLESIGGEDSRDTLHGRVEAGATLGASDGLNLRADAFYDGIGTDWSIWGASLGFGAALR